jgi:hypothetical protein
LKELDECELITKKARLVFDACEADEQLHHRLKTEKRSRFEFSISSHARMGQTTQIFVLLLEDAIESVKSEIEGLKQELERAKTDRKNNEEYVQFARKVNEQRTRPDLTKFVDQFFFILVCAINRLITILFPFSCPHFCSEIMVVEGEIAELDAELLSFQQTYDFRAKQVKLLVAALQQLEADFDLDKLAQDIERDKV